MKTQGWLFAALTSVGGVALLGCSPSASPCTLADAHGGPALGSPGTPYLAIYYYRQGSQTGACADDPTDFAANIFEESYPTSANGPKEVAWTPAEFAYDVNTGAPPDPSRDPAVRGRFTDVSVNESGLCDVEGTAPGQQEIGGILVTYQFKRVQSVSTAAVQGTEILADVAISRGGCSREYDVLGLWPPVTCATTVDCNPLPDPNHGHRNGSGVVPSLPVECNTGPILGDGAGGGKCFFPNASPAGFPYLTQANPS